VLQRSGLNKNEVEDIQQFINARKVPDIIFIANIHLQTLNQLGLTMNLANLIKSHNTKMSDIEPSIIHALPIVSGSEEITALPLYRNIVATFYNKDLFDKFGITYPKDGMTYSQAVDLAKKLTRSDGGSNYFGIFPGGYNIQRGQLSQNILDPVTGKSLLVSSEAFRQIFDLQNEIFHIPGMEMMTNAQARNHFFKDKSLAMLMDWVANFITLAKKSNGVNWDMATMPVFNGKPKTHSGVDFHTALITKTSEHPEEAYSVISYLTTSKDVQTLLSKAGRIPVLIDPAVLKAFGGDFLKGKNISVLEKTKMAPLTKTHSLENVGKVRAPLNAVLNKIVKGTTDVNSALREASGAIDQYVAAESSK
jgi:multiple sugar transport system substrate-binding protein